MPMTLRGETIMLRKIRGVTLIELLIVVVIVSILAAVAYPNYRSYVQKSKRNEAKAALLQIATNQERHYLNNNEYTLLMTELGFSGDNDVSTGSGTYTVDVVAADANGYTAIATYTLDDEEKAKCETFTITADGAKTSAPRADCWTSTQ
jgi:type IV pilus assembly protein PilE